MKYMVLILFLTALSMITAILLSGKDMHTCHGEHGNSCDSCNSCNSKKDEDCLNDENE